MELGPFDAPALRGAELSADGKRVVAWHAREGRLDPIELWDLRGAPAVRLLPPSKHPSAIPVLHRFVFGADGNVIAGAAMSSLTIWDTTTRAVLRDEQMPDVALSASPLGKRITAVGQDGQGAVIDLDRGVARKPFQIDLPKKAAPGAGPVFAAKMLNEDVAAVLTTPERIVLIDAERGGVRRSIAGASEGLPRVASAEIVERKGKRLKKPEWRFAVAFGARVELLDGETLATTGAIVRGGPEVEALAFDERGETLAVVTADGAVSTYDVETRARRARILDPKARCRFADAEATEPAFVLAASGRSAACVTREAVLLFDLSGKGAEPMELPRGRARFVDRDRRLVVVGDDDRLSEVAVDSGRDEKPPRTLASSKEMIPSLSARFEFRATAPADTRLERLSDGAIVRLRALAGASTAPAVYTEDGTFSGDDAACRALFVRVEPSGARAPLTAAECEKRRRPGLANDFFAGRRVGGAR